MQKSTPFTKAGAAVVHGDKGHKSAGAWHIWAINAAAQQIAMWHRAQHPVRGDEDDAITFEGLEFRRRRNLLTSIGPMVVERIRAFEAERIKNPDLLMGPPPRGRKLSPADPRLPIKAKAGGKVVPWNSKAAIRLREKLSKGFKIPVKINSGTLEKAFLRKRDDLNAAIQYELEMLDFRNAMKKHGSLRPALESLNEDETLIAVALELEARLDAEDDQSGA